MRYHLAGSFGILIMVLASVSSRAYGGDAAPPEFKVASGKLTSEEYGMLRRCLSVPITWDQGSIFLADVQQVVSAGGTPVPRFVKLRVREVFGQYPIPEELVLPPGSFAQVRVGGLRVPSYRPKPGDSLLLACDHNARSPRAMLALPVARGDRERWLRQLRQIETFRQAKGKEARAKAGEELLRGEGALGVMYVGRFVYDLRDRRDIPDSWRPLFLKARDNENLLLYARLLMSQTMLRCDKAYERGQQHVKWLRHWFDEPRGLGHHGWGLVLRELYCSIKRAEIARTDLPHLMKLIHSPATGIAEKEAILYCLGGAVRGMEDKLAGLVLAEALTNSQMLKVLGDAKNLEIPQFLHVVRAGISRIDLRLRAAGTGADAEKDVEMLRKYKTMLTRLSKKAVGRKRLYINWRVSDCDKLIQKHGAPAKKDDRPQGKSE